MILDLTAPFPFNEKSVYKNQAKERLGDLLSFSDSKILPDYSQESSWRTFFLRVKRIIDSEPDIPERETLP